MDLCSSKTNIMLTLLKQNKLLSYSYFTFNLTLLTFKKKNEKKLS